MQYGFLYLMYIDTPNIIIGKGYISREIVAFGVHVYDRNTGKIHLYFSIDLKIVTLSFVICIISVRNRKNW